MKTKEKIKTIQKLVKEYKRLISNFHTIYELFGNTDSEFCDSVWHMFDSYVALVSKTIGDDYSYIAWFIYDNDCGKKGLDCSFNKKVYKIKTVKDLVEFMEKEEL